MSAQLSHQPLSARSSGSICKGRVQLAQNFRPPLVFILGLMRMVPGMELLMLVVMLMMVVGRGALGSRLMLWHLLTPPMAWAVLVAGALPATIVQQLLGSPGRVLPWGCWAPPVLPCHVLYSLHRVDR